MVPLILYKKSHTNVKTNKFVFMSENWLERTIRVGQTYLSFGLIPEKFLAPPYMHIKVIRNMIPKIWLSPKLHELKIRANTAKNEN